MENNSNRNYGQDDRNSQNQQPKKWANSNEEDNEARKAADRENSAQSSPGRNADSDAVASGTNPDRYATSTQRGDNESDDIDTDSESDRADYRDTDNPGVRHPEQ